MTWADVTPCLTACCSSADGVGFAGGRFPFRRRIGRIKRIVGAVGNGGLFFFLIHDAIDDVFLRYDDIITNLQ